MGHGLAEIFQFPGHVLQVFFDLRNLIEDFLFLAQGHGLDGADLVGHRLQFAIGFGDLGLKGLDMGFDQGFGVRLDLTDGITDQPDTGKGSQYSHYGNDE